MLLLTSSVDLSTRICSCVLASMDTRLSLMPAAILFTSFFLWRYKVFYGVTRCFFMKDRHNVRGHTRSTKTDHVDVDIMDRARGSCKALNERESAET